MAGSLIEHINDPAALYRRINLHQVDPATGFPSSAAFKDENASVNWERYSTPESTAGPTSLFVLGIRAGVCRRLCQKVEHAPDDVPPGCPPNPAHALIKGKKPRPKATKLRDLATVVWAREAGHQSRVAALHPF